MGTNTHFAGLPRVVSAPDLHGYGTRSWASVDKPHFHVAPGEGWINDPNGPLYFNGAYHIFYQHLPGSAQWGFNLVWGHSTSKDLVHWQLMEHAIEPMKGSVDNDGCFSGCAAIDTDGTPCLLYSAVRLRGSGAAGPLPPPECDLSLPFIETQCIVYAENPHADWRLPSWRKSNVPVISLPPANLKLAGWRDPYIVGPPVCHPERGWTILIGSGIKEQGGTTLVYRTRNIRNGWKLAGELCSGKQEDGTGIVWECPLMAKLDPLDSARLPPGFSIQDYLSIGVHHQKQQKQQHEVHCLSEQAQRNANGPHAINLPGSSPAPLSRRHFFCISPDACTNPTYYYLGDYLEPEEVTESTLRSTSTMEPNKHQSKPVYGNNISDSSGMGCPKFLVRDALGPFRLDLGDILYAPNTLMDMAKGRMLLFAWLQEARKVAGTYTYAGCLCLPRELWLDYSSGPDRPFLLQRPVDEVIQLRLPGHTWTYNSPCALPPRWIQEEAPSLSGYRRPSMCRDENGVCPTPSSHPLSLQGIKEMEISGQPHPSQATQGLRSHPLNPFEQGMGKEGGLLGITSLTPEEQQTMQQLAEAAHGSEVAYTAAMASAGDPLLLGPGQAFAVPIVEGPFLEVEVVLELAGNDGKPHRLPKSRAQQGATAERGAGADVTPAETATLEEEGVRRTSAEHTTAIPPSPVGACSGMVLRSWQAGVEGAAAVLYCWDTGVLEVVFEALDPETHEYSLAAPGCRRVGGKLQKPPVVGQPMALRLFIDYSLLEVYTGSGEVLSTRVYRGVGPPGGGAGVEVVSVGCNTHVAYMAAHEVSPCYVADQQDSEQPVQFAAGVRPQRKTSDPGTDLSPKDAAALEARAATPPPVVLTTGEKTSNHKTEAEELAETRQRLSRAALGLADGFDSKLERLLAPFGITLPEEEPESAHGPKKGLGPFSFERLGSGGRRGLDQLQGIVNQPD